MTMSEKGNLISLEDELPAIEPAMRRWMCPEIPNRLRSSCKSTGKRQGARGSQIKNNKTHCISLQMWQKVSITKNTPSDDIEANHVSINNLLCHFLHCTFLYLSKAMNWMAPYGNILTIIAPLPLYKPRKPSFFGTAWIVENTPAKTQPDVPLMWHRRVKTHWLFRVCLPIFYLDVCNGGSGLGEEF